MTKKKDDLVVQIVERNMLFMPLRELLDKFSDDHYGDLPMRNVLRRAEINMTKHYSAQPLEDLESEWEDISNHSHLEEEDPNEY